MFRRKFHLGSVVCLANEALRQMLQVEFGSRIELNWLDIDPGRIKDEEANITFKGEYRRVSDGNHYRFKASILLSPGADKKWRPREGKLTVTMSPEYTMPYEAHWATLHDKYWAVFVDCLAYPKTERTFGVGYAADERWKAHTPGISFAV